MDFVHTGTYQQNLSETGISEREVEEQHKTLKVDDEVLQRFPGFRSSAPLVTLSEQFKDSEEREYFELSQTNNDETPAQECTDEDYRFIAAYHARQRRQEKKKELEDAAAVEDFLKEKQQYFSEQRDQLDSKTLEIQQNAWNKLKEPKLKKPSIVDSKFRIKKTRKKPMTDISSSSSVAKEISKR